MTESIMPFKLGAAWTLVRRCPRHRGVAVALAQSSQAQDYPTRPVTLIVPWAPGGAVDTLARIVAPKLTERLGKPVVIENRPGGGSTIGTATGAKARAGRLHARHAGSGSMAISPAMYKSLPYDPTKDFAPMALVGRVPFVLIVNRRAGQDRRRAHRLRQDQQAQLRLGRRRARRIISTPSCSRA